MITNIPLPGAYWAEAIAVNENTGYVYVGNSNASDSIWIIDGSTDTIVQTVDATGSCGFDFEYMLVNKNTNMIYVGSDEEGPLLVLDGNPASATFHTIIGQGGHMASGYIAVNEVTNRVYMAVNEGHGGILVFDGTTNTITDYIDTGGTAYDLAFDGAGNRVWVAHTSTDGIKIIDTVTNSVTDLGLGVPVSDVLFNPNTNRVYALTINLLSSSIKVKVIDANTWPLGEEADIPLSGCGWIEAWEINPITNRLYVLNGNQVDVIEGDPAVIPDFNTKIATVPLPLVEEAEGIAINANTNLIYVGHEADGITPTDVHVIDGATNTLLTTIQVGIEADVVVVNQTTNRIYTSNDASHSISVIDGNPLNPTFHTVIATIPLDDEPEELLVNEATNRLYVNVDGNSTIAVIDGSSNAIEKVIPLPQGSEELNFALDSALNYIYAADEELGVMHVIDGNPASALFNTIIKTIDVGAAPWSIVVDEATHDFYVANEDDNSITRYTYPDTDGDKIIDVIDTDDDNDDMPDTYENQYAFLDPRDPTDANRDQDNDGLTNREEFDATTDPTKEDTDRDGLSDKYELDNGLDPTDSSDCPDWICGGSRGWRHAIPLS